MHTQFLYIKVSFMLCGYVGYLVELRAAITTQVGRPLRTKPFLISVGMHGKAIVVVVCMIS